MGARMSLAGPMSEFLGIFVISILLVYGGSLVLIDGSMSGSAFIAYMGLAYQILTPAKAITKANQALLGGNAAYERVAFILDATNHLQDKPDAQIITEFNSEIKFTNVSFKYDSEYVLRDFNLCIKALALVTENLQGKEVEKKIAISAIDKIQDIFILTLSDIVKMKRNLEAKNISFSLATQGKVKGYGRRHGRKRWLYCVQL
jgi:subfamily B ATP-binding cassette protein MsbA